MYSFGKLKNRVLILLVSLLIVFMIGFADQITGGELSFSVFYLVPIILLALYRDTKIKAIITCSIFAALTWFFCEYSGRDYSTVLFPMWNAFGNLIIYTSIGLLIHYLKEKHKRLSAANKLLTASNKEKNIFVGVAVHDLRNPISGIYSLSDLLLKNHKEDTETAVIEGLDYIKTLSSNTLSILKDVLSVSRLGSGKVELEIKSHDYNSFIKEQITLNQLIAKQKKIHIEFISKEESIIADFDENHMREVIDNLLSNAIKYSDPKNEITVITSLAVGDIVMTKVIDKGKGIAQEEQENLFNYFQTTSTQPTNGEQSTGLGLAIAKQIINLHKGDLWVKSAPNMGSTFYYTFPQNSQKTC